MLQIKIEEDGVLTDVIEVKEVPTTALDGYQHYVWRRLGGQWSTERVAHKQEDGRCQLASTILRRVQE